MDPVSLLIAFRMALLGTTMCPGYTNDSYEHGDRGALIKAYPQAGAEILRLTTS